ncbi:hypothetical protein CesoFtcFv8_002045, partial [Champsocephalus esox]
CQPASLACEKLLRPVDKAPDLSGRWYVIACVWQMIDRVLSPSVHVVEVTSKETPHFYDFIVKAKIYGLCGNEIQRFFLENNKLFDVDSNNASHGVPDVLLQTGCPDCIVSEGPFPSNTHNF